MWIGKIISLEDLCFNVIVKKFEEFYFAFTISKDRNFQQNFQFLLRRCSNKLIVALYFTFKLKEEYLGLLINEHVKFLYNEWFRNSQFQNSLEIFSHLPNLTSVTFRDCNDELLENVAKFCPKIVKIDAGYSKVTDGGIKFLCNRKNGLLPCPKLKNIDIKGTLVSKEGVEYLIRNLPSLERIDYTNLPLVLHNIHKENSSKIENVHCCNLIYLNFLEFEEFKNLSNFIDILKSCFAVCSKLESLACCILDEEPNVFISHYLKKLDLRSLDPKIDRDNIIKLNGSNLTFLSISNCNISLSVLAKHCRALKEMQLYCVNFKENDDDEYFMPVVSSLTKCTFQQVDSSANKTVKLLFTCSPNLKTISFLLGHLSLEIKTYILLRCQCPSVKEIDFQYLELKMEYLKDVLLSCPSLKEMSLTYCFLDVKKPRELFLNLIKSLPNKPNIYFA